VLDDAVYNGDASATAGVVVVAGQTLTWTGDLALGAIATVTYSVTVNDPDTGDRALTDTVTSASPGNTCPVGGTDPACTATVTVLIPALSIVKTADAPAVTPGGTVGYTITLTNTGQTPYTGANVSDSLEGMLDEAVYNEDATATTGILDYDDGVLTWIGDLAIGASATVTYSVTVNDPVTGDDDLTNTVTSTTPGNTCPEGGTDPACTASVEVDVPELRITKAADTAVVVAGSAVHYTVTIANTGETAYDDATVADALAGVLDDAVYQNDATASVGAVTYDDDVLTWTGDLAIGVTATVTYSVDVTYPASGNRVLDNAVTSAETGSTCPEGTDPGCATTVAVIVPGLAITLTSDTNGDIVAAGTVHYTIVAANTGEAPYAAATLTTLLAGVLDNAAYNGDASASSGSLTFTGTNLDWTGALPLNATTVITFSVTANDPVTGDGLLDARVVAEATGSTCPVGSTDPGCSSSITVTATSIVLTDLSEEFTLTGLPNTTVGGEGVVTMTVTTNSVNGYTVTARSTSPELVPVTPGVTDRIPVANLRVRESGTPAFSPLSATTPVLVHQQSGPSAPGGDAISNDYEVDIPFVAADRYSTTIDYVAMTP
jgi:uncharacterized repeat protein (TIGR01451 family)